MRVGGGFAEVLALDSSSLPHFECGELTLAAWERGRAPPLANGTEGSKGSRRRPLGRSVGPCIMAKHLLLVVPLVKPRDPDPPANAASSKKSRHQAEKHKEHKFAEGWTIGGKKGTRHRDDVWTMKYLPRFRWDMLSEQVALERATQTSLLRFHLQHSRTEQESYLSAVEKARVGRKIEEKKQLDDVLGRLF
ncbi:hypothetical protein BCR35DRAFT_140631 [Leucosporidium creatinivorum]|uniref:Uncharacterized protein n=1 Tax=Leucosporidium creatinivorum TaxID=106004 RepID=A0A1Y2ESH7_9BASI|nr:hypothetical protein BCR35DRAFT_140631 [Leucosporidium creatinivorum]